MAYQTTILTQVLKHVNRHDFQKQVSMHNGDHKVSNLNCFSLLVAMIFAHLKTNRTIRDIVLGFETATNRLYHLGMKTGPKRSTISDSLANRPARVFEDYYRHVLASLNRNERRRLGMKVNLIDSTTISMCIEKFEWAKYRKKKGGIKLHVMLDSKTHLAEQVLITNAVCHDMNAIRGVIEFKKGQMYVYDRGYACYNYLYDIELAGAFFVTRIKSNWKVRVMKNLCVRRGTGVLKDQLIRVTGTKKDEYPATLRLVTFHHKESGKTLKFLTNNMRLSAKRIADIYKTRWQIELFFKWIKQHLKVKTFLSTTANGVKIQIWCALITYVLLHKIKELVVSEIDIFTIYRRIQDHLFEGIDLFDLLSERVRKRKMREEFDQPELLYA
jgi:hypothetical protein